MIKKIWIAGGCFWGVQKYFDNLKGVVSTTVGYSQGTIENPTYQQVKTGTTNYVETVEINYDDRILSLTKIFEHLFNIIDPYSLNKQGEDVGTQYRSGIYYIDYNDYLEAKEFLETKQRVVDHKIMIELKQMQNYYLAEEYHQKYLEKNPGSYCHINLDLMPKKDRK